MGVGEVKETESFREKIARRAAQEIEDGMIINLGIGIPTLVADFIPKDKKVLFHAENGILGTGPSPAPGEENPMLCNAGGFPVTLATGASFFDSATAFAIIRRGLLDMTILGVLEVSERGDIANWIVPGKRVPGMGGAMELAQKAKKVMVLTTHLDKNGRSKIVRECSLPLTAVGAAHLIITDMAVMEVREDGLYLKEVMHPYTVADVIGATEAELKMDEEVRVFR
ncbi:MULTISPECIES: 3-oxoacid CoA-transferase subunit B [Brevibacillus]|jgi:acetate CoA/acetoacetate CoA-transferase beta subunit|uniref:Acetate CoA-transferase subunit B n=1 Tax=Brevibacillus borstelensis AK1 TaxID=1300222 RepID=M8E3R5_9BACL|nr:3-oxoacid CoA-transferase subunit B [Brevibacillus borstelensis]EMT53931.1 acetate CoA-transferase subunit B [Brevibacillus borstelensis AK1]KKX56676.1 CoA-transferase [Brevibacillus borstelensis cifa_chp40]MBE5394714.1 3-oxoacid CoA-transferase subunit B [Brevibacillus borstelensis]MCC0565321.1 3-oxoacid CoA-transferase subunit B [Brevibacillus borstelensis]MCM3470824.1 3-oxoacid CoA-transferase subunit B [Brevibacillus borstelensis]